MHKEIRVSITVGSVIATFGVALGVYLIWLLRDLILLVITAIVIASAIEPGVAFLVRHRLSRFFAVLCTYAATLGIVFGLLYFFVPPILNDAGTFLNAVPEYLKTIPLPSISDLGENDFLPEGGEAVDSMRAALAVFEDTFTLDSAGAVQLASTFFGGIFSLILVIVLSFYFALQETGVDDFLRLILPTRHEDYAVNLWKRSQKKIGLWMQGQLLLSLIVGILVYLGLVIIGVPYALFLAVLTGVAEIIPIFGSLFAGAVAVMIAFSAGGVPIALIVLGLYIVVNQFESNLIYPLVVRQVVGLPPLLVILALIAGGTLAGFLGILLSVPVAATLLELLSDFEKKKRGGVPV